MPRTTYKKRLLIFIAAALTLVLAPRVPLHGGSTNASAQAQ
jgi:hypothetical protein